MTPRPRLRRSIRIAVALVLASPLFYLAAAGIGLLPANRDFRSAATGIDIYVTSNGVHTDIVLPTESDFVDWTTLFPASDFPANAALSHVQFGWGDRQFFVETPTWADIRPLTVLKASLLPTSATMHVQYCPEPAESPECRRIRLAPESYRTLVRQLKRTIVLNSAGLPVRMEEPGYVSFDGFYDAHGSYHLFNTCNAWTGKTLRCAGVRVGIWTPFPNSVMATLPVSTRESGVGNAES